MDGIWSVEIYGLDGWESVGVLVVDGADVVGGGNHHYTVGRLESGRREVRMALSLDYFGTPRTLFGEAGNHTCVELEGEHEGDDVHGTLRNVGRPNMQITTRLHRLVGLPAGYRH